MEKRRKIRNPFDADQNMCFGCGPNNHAGLRLTFEEDESKLYASWEPEACFQGYINVLHGGIIATLLDEAGAWCIYVKAGTSGVTASTTAWTVAAKASTAAWTATAPASTAAGERSTGAGLMRYKSPWPASMLRT